MISTEGIRRQGEGAGGGVGALACHACDDAASKMAEND